MSGRVISNLALSMGLAAILFGVGFCGYIVGHVNAPTPNQYPVGPVMALPFDTEKSVATEIRKPCPIKAFPNAAEVLNLDKSDHIID